MRIALIADSHLSPRSPECVANWHAARRAVERLSPDLTVHLGDISLDGHTHPDELGFAARAGPGVGRARCFACRATTTSATARAKSPSMTARSDTYARLFGADHWCTAGDRWQLIGINAQLLGSETAQEDRTMALARGAGGRDCEVDAHRALSAPPRSPVSARKIRSEEGDTSQTRRASACCRGRCSGACASSSRGTRTSTSTPSSRVSATCGSLRPASSFPTRCRHGSARSSSALACSSSSAQRLAVRPLVPGRDGPPRPLAR